MLKQPKDGNALVIMNMHAVVIMMPLVIMNNDATCDHE